MAALAATACSDKPIAVPPPVDRPYFPTDLELRKLPDGRSTLLVSSSNFDLRYDNGTVLSVDPDASTEQQLAVLGAAAIGNFAGEVAYVDAANCPGWTGPGLAVVPTRGGQNVARIGLGDDGSLFCDTGIGDGLQRCEKTCADKAGRCSVALPDIPADPYGVGVVCRPSPVTGESTVTAYVSHLRARGDRGWLSTIDLLTGALGAVDLGPATTRAMVLDASASRLFVTGRGGGDYNPIRSLDVSTLTPTAGAVNLFGVVRSLDTRGIAISNDGLRAYVTLRLPDSLAVLDLTPDPSGRPSQRLLQVISLPLGPSEVRVLPPRAGKRDLVAITCTDSDSLVIYDDDDGMLATQLSPTSRLGYPLSRSPFAMAVQSVSPTLARLYVGSFDKDTITVVDVDLDNPRGAFAVRRLGPERQ